VIRRSIRWALIVAVIGSVIAIALGAIALGWDDDERAESASGPIEGTYTYASTDIVLNTPFARSPQLQITGGRLAIGADGHVFWSLQMHSRDDTSRTGRLSCEGRLDSAKRTVAPSVRYGYSDFAPDLANFDIQTSIYGQFCAGYSVDGPDNKPWEIAQEADVLHLKGRGGAISWRRE
jgi:hypothetical protein